MESGESAKGIDLTEDQKLAIALEGLSGKVKEFDERDADLQIIINKLGGYSAAELAPYIDELKTLQERLKGNMEIIEAYKKAA
jgi:hypothetical protein